MPSRYSTFMRNFIQRFTHCQAAPITSYRTFPIVYSIPFPIRAAVMASKRRLYGTNNNGNINNSNLDKHQQNLQICWHCGKTVRQRIDRVLCSHCRRLQPLCTSMDYFAYLGVDDPNSPVDDVELKRHFRYMQSLVHPDKYSGRDEYERNLSDQHSTFLNNAYRTLRDPFSRAEYLLNLLEKLKGDVSESMSAVELEEEGTVEDTSVAAEMMELMESLDQLPRNSPEIGRRIVELDTEIYQLLRTATDQMVARELDDARQTLRRISYLRRSRRLLDAKMGDASGGRWGGEHD